MLCTIRALTKPSLTIGARRWSSTVTRRSISHWAHPYTRKSRIEAYRQSRLHSTASSATTVSAAALGQTSTAMSRWLFGCAGIVAGIVVLGGATRLTKSGLSMVEWKFHGSLPPLDEQQWQAAFDKYKEYPEFQRVNFHMSLDEFKFIYLMEWAHRMAGRAVGLCFALPLAYFALRGRVQRPLGKRLAAMLGLGAMQGLIGWWMVRSGLEKPVDQYYEPKVSPYRLTVHLASAFTLYSMLLDTAMKLSPASTSGKSLLSRAAAAPPALRGLAIGAAHLVALTVLSGAFVAGNRAGLVYNEFPLMGGRFVPEDYLQEGLEPKWRNLFENSSLVQFDHRWLGVGSLAFITGLFVRSRGVPLPPNARTALNTVLGVAGAQVGLGITTLLTFVPVPLGVMHQAGALTLLSSLLWLVHTLGPRQAKIVAGKLLKNAKV